MPYPKLSTVLNNCPLYALTPEIKDEVLKFRDNAPYDNKHNANYSLLKDKFAVFYGFDPAAFSWKQFADILESYNAFDTQIIMGPVLRLFMKDKMAENEFVLITAQANGVSPEEFIKSYTEIKPATARYESLTPDELFAHVGQHLGLISLQYFPQEKPLAQDPVAQVDIYHQGGIEGAQDGGHWERTDKGEGSIDYQNHDDTQLNSFLPLLGQEAAVNPYGFDLLKKHVQLTARSNDEENDLHDEFTELRTSASQITQYKYNIVSVPKNLAVKLLGPGLTDDTRHFIAHYEFTEVHENKIYELWINAEESQKPKIDEYEHLIIERLTSPVPQTVNKVDPGQAEVQQQEVELKRQQEVELKRQQEVELKRQQEVELKRQQEVELKRQQEVELKRQQEAELKRQQEAELKRQQEAEEKYQKPKVDQQPERHISQAERNFNKQLELLDEKIKELEKRRDKAELNDPGKFYELNKACTAADTLKSKLSAAGTAFFNNPTDTQYRLFKKSCHSEIKTARQTLNKHRGWSEFLVNLALGIATAGIGLLVKGAINIANNRSFFFVHQTKSSQVLDKIEESIENANKPKPGA